jgi:hypothetical protein
MNRRSVLAAVVAVAFCVASVVTGQAPGGGAGEGLLLLKNGETLTGSIVRSGDYYVVATADSELQIRLHDAEALCRDLDEAYRLKGSKINPRSADDHVTLAQWCIDKKLYGHAARELTAAYRIDDTHPRIVLLERRLKAAMSEPKTPVPAAPKATTAGVGDDVLEQTARSVSPEVLHEFTTRVQPLLVNYCATAGCHGPKPASTFQLHRVYLNERHDLRLVRSNLHAVLALVDRAKVAASPLLTVPLSPHGGATKPLFHAHNAEHYRVLASWAVRAASATEATPPTATVATPAADAATGPLLQRLPMTPPTRDGVPAPPVSTPAQSVAPSTTTPPVDPFDPADFNRRRETP